MSSRNTRLALPLLLVLAAPALGAQNALVNWETPHVHPLEMTGDGSFLLAVNTPDNRLEVFNLASGLPEHVGSIPVGLDPVSVRARTDTEVWVVNHVSDSVSIVDLTTGNVSATLDTDDEPCDVVFADVDVEGRRRSVARRAFVSCSQANTLLVFDLSNLEAPPARIAIRGEDPRALAVSPAGDQVYVAVFESGNRTSILGGGAMMNIGFPPNVVSDPAGPYAGVNPPPNSGVAFDPPLANGLPAPPRVGLIVRRDDSGAWLDDNGGDWTALVSGPQAALSGRPVGWTLLDHDVAIVDADSLAVSYADGLMNLNMALAVKPASGEVTVVGTDATNEVRFEPNVSGRFVRVELARFDPSTPGTHVIGDLNAHLDYAEATIDQSERDKTLGDPRGIAWNAAGTRGYVSGMGSNNVVVVDGSGMRAGSAPAIEVAEGPTGLVLDEARGQLYVLAKFAAVVSVVDTASELEIRRVRFFDPSPPAVKKGRKHLYDTHATSGTGLVSCASCHIDARLDRLAWDLGNPAGAVKPLGTDQNLGADVPGLNVGFEDWHPMKGPMLTQTLQDIIGHEPHHWRGDRDGLEEFNPAFEGLLGDDEQLTAQEMQEFEDFLATIFYPPNPFRDFDNTLPTSLPLPGHFTTGRFGPAGQPLPNGNAVAGQQSFRPPTLLDAGALACVTCHTRPTGAGTDHQLVGGTFQPVPTGPNGEHHLALVAVDGLTNVTMKIPQLRNLYERTGFDTTQLESTAGFGFVHDGSVDSIARFIDEPVFNVQSDQQTANLVAFMLAFSGVRPSLGSTSNLLEPLGPPSQATHAAVGTQTTLDGPPDAAQDALLDAMILEADQGDVGLVVKGKRGGLQRGWVYRGADEFQSDREAETDSRAFLELVALFNEVTFTVVPKGSEQRIGIDRDSDGYFDRDELDQGSDPADAGVRPRHRRVPQPKLP